MGADDPLRALADRSALADLCEGYLRLHDEGRFGEATARAYLTEDVLLRFPPGDHEGLAGLDAFTDRYMGHWAATHHQSSRHLVGLAGDRATVSWNVLATHVHRGSPPPPAPGLLFRLGGRFDGDAVRTAAGWRLRRLSLTVAWTTGTGVPAIAAAMARDRG